MKKYLFIVLIIGFLAEVNAQTIIVRGEEYPNLPRDFKETGQYYYKDVYNYLNSFVGTWEYIDGNKRFELTLTKKTFYHVDLPHINLNYYKDGITVRYKQYENGVLIYESPLDENPSLSSKNGILLEGFFSDHNRLTAPITVPLSNEILSQGGRPLNPECHIEKIITLEGEPKQISFELFCHLACGRYDYDTYEGMPFFSVPSDIILTKQP